MWTLLILPKTSKWWRLEGFEFTYLIRLSTSKQLPIHIQLSSGAVAWNLVPRLHSKFHRAFLHHASCTAYLISMLWIYFGPCDTNPILVLLTSQHLPPMERSKCPDTQERWVLQVITSRTPLGNDMKDPAQYYSKRKQKTMGLTLEDIIFSWQVCNS